MQALGVKSKTTCGNRMIILSLLAICFNLGMLLLLPTNIRPARDKHSSLLKLLVNYESKIKSQHRDQGPIS
jgi:hypothetical protein